MRERDTETGEIVGDIDTDIRCPDCDSTDVILDLGCMVCNNCGFEF